jgi:glutathione S-transferase
VHFKELTFDLSNKPKELLEMNPAGTVPVLKGVDGKIITESEGMIRREKKKA